MKKIKLFFLLTFLFYARSLEAQRIEGVSITACEDNTIIEAYGKNFESCSGLFIKTTTLPTTEYHSLIIELGKGDFFPVGKCTDLTLGNEAGGCDGKNKIDNFLVCRPEIVGISSPKEPICPGEEVLLSFYFNVPDGFSGEVGNYVKWSTGARGESITFITEKDTIIRATYWDHFGCKQEYDFPIIIESTNCVDCLEAIVDTCANKAILEITKDGNPLWEDGSTESIREIELPGTFFVDIISPNGCHLVDTIKLEAYPESTNCVDCLAAIVEPCTNKATLKITKDGDPLWEDGSTESIREIELPGTFFVDIISPYGCHLMDTIKLEASPIPLIQLGDSIITKEGQPAWVNIEKINPKESTYWTFLPFFVDSLANLTIFEDFHIPNPLTSGYLIARQINEFGCENIDSTWIEVIKDTDRKPCTRKIYPANAFSPNGDGHNDYWFLQSEDAGEIVSLAVYDRWGGQLYERHSGATNNIYDAWDGYSNKKKVPLGLYVFQATISFIDGEVCSSVGDLTIKE